MKQENARNTDNPTVYNRLRRYDLSCSACPPHRSENAGRKPKFGVKKARRKNHRKNHRRDQ